MVREGVPPPPQGRHAHNVVAQNTPQQQIAKRRRSQKIEYLRLSLDVDLAKKAIVGYTDLFFLILEPLNEIRIQLSSQCDVSGVSIEGIGPVSYKHFSSIPEEEFMKTGNEKQFSLLKGCEEIVADNFANETGFLLVYLPHTVTPGSQVVVRVFYELFNPYAGVYFVSPNDDEDTLPYMYTHNQVDGANLWLPSQDGNSMIPFEAEITTHPDVVVVSSGELVKQELSESNPLKVSYIQQKTPILIRHIGLAVGVFKTIRDPNLNNVLHFYPEGSSNSLVTEKNVQYTTRFFSQAVDFMEEFLDTSYTDMFTTYKQVFIGRPYTKTASFATFSLISENMILDPRVIEGTMDTRVEMAYLVAKQFFDQFIVSKRWSDIWLMLGISGYLAGKFMQKVFGDNEYRYFLHQEMKKLDCPEVHLQPLYCEELTTPSELVNPMTIRKSGLVLYMIENQIGSSNMQKLLHHILSNGLRDMEKLSEISSPSTPLTASSSSEVGSPFMNGDTPVTPSTPVPSPSTPRFTRRDKASRRQMSTKEFIKMIRKSFGTDLRQFAEYWIYSVGIPKFNCGFRYDPKRGMLEFALKQIPSPAPNAKLFKGPINIRIHEVDGTYDHTIRVEEEINYYEFLCHTKPRKQRQRPPPNYPIGSGKETEKVQMPTTTVPANQPETGPGTEIPIHWVRVDPELELVRLFDLKQPEDMWVWQLETDRDVIAQEEALHALFEFNTSKETMYNLDAFVYNTVHYYRMRILALHALARYANSALKFEPLDMLYQYLKHRHYDKTQTYIKPNNFSDFAEYFIKKELPLAIASVRDDAGMSPSDVTDFLIDLLKNNDNSENEYVDSYYVSSIIRALGMVRIEQIDRAEKHIEHMLLMDSMLPSHQRCLTRSAMAAMTELQLCRLSSLKIEVFWDFVKRKHIYPVRLEALHCLLKFYSSQTFSEGLNFKEGFTKLLEIIEDPKEEPKMQHKVAIQLANCIYKTVPNNKTENQSPLGTYVNFLRSSHESNRSMVKRLWRLLRGPMCEHDTRLRMAIIQLYNIIWGIYAPLCFNPSQKYDVIPPEDFLFPENKKKQKSPSSKNKIQTSKSKPSASSSSIAAETKSQMISKTARNNKKRKTPVEDKKETEKTDETGPPPAKKNRRDSKESKATSTKKKKKKSKKISSDKTQQQQQQQEQKASTKPSSIKLRFKMGTESKTEKKTDQSTIPTATTTTTTTPVSKTTTVDSSTVSPAVNVGVDSDRTESSDEETKSQDLKTSIQSTEPVTLKQQKQKKKTKKSKAKHLGASDSTSLSSELKAKQQQQQQQQQQQIPKTLTSTKKERQYQVTYLPSNLKPLKLTNRTIAISISEEFFFYARLYNHSSTADAVYRSIPTHKNRLQGVTGIAFFEFALPTVKEESDTRDVVKRGELAFWKDGTAICIGLEPSPYSTNAREIRLYCPCNIFGIINWSVSSRNLTPMKEPGRPVCLTRPRRVVVCLGNVEIYLDLYRCSGADEILRMLPLRSELQNFGQSFYFSYSPDRFDDEVANSDSSQIGVTVKRRIDFGDIALWVRGNSIVVGSGYTDASASTKDNPVLLEECPIIGTLASSRAQVIKRLPTKSPSAPISVYKRIVEVKLEDRAQFIVEMYDTVTADVLWEALPSTSALQTWAEMIYFPVDLHGREIKDEPSAKRVLEPEEMAFWTSESTVCIAYGFTPVSTRVPGTLKEPCNVWGRAINVDLQELLRSANISPDTQVTLSKVFAET